MCHLFIFTAKKDGDIGGGGGGDDDETFLETENRELEERNRVQNAAIVSLEKDKNDIATRVKLEHDLLLASELQVETEKSAKDGLLREKASFMAALHEVRNPLNGIVLTLEYIDDSLAPQIGGPASKELKEELQTIKTCAGHQTLLLKSIMDLDKIMAGNKELPTEDFNPATVCGEVLAMNKHAAKPGVRISLNAAPEADFEFVGAPTQLNLVLVNLMSNALKFTTEGKVELSVAVVEDQYVKDQDAINKEGDCAKVKVLRFAVTDTGPGVPREQQEKIFGMRGQAGNETSKAKGFGFGLFVAHELVERMGGKIELQSPVEAAAREEGAKGGGSMFSFEIRVSESASQPGVHRSSSAALVDRLKQQLMDEVLPESTSRESPPEAVEEVYRGGEKEKEKKGEREALSCEGHLTMKGWRVLLADDSDLNLRLLARKFTSGPFEKLGWQVETASTGEKALAKISETSGREGEGRRFDLVVFDENMQPEGLLLGTEATRVLRKEDETVLIVGCTGNSTDDDKKRSEESGQDLFWRKPAPPSKEALQDIVGALVKRMREKYRKDAEKNGGERKEGEGEGERGKGEKEKEEAVKRKKGGYKIHCTTSSQ